MLKWSIYWQKIHLFFCHVSSKNAKTFGDFLFYFEVLMSKLMKEKKKPKKKKMASIYLWVELTDIWHKMYVCVHFIDPFTV